MISLGQFFSLKGRPLNTRDLAEVPAWVWTARWWLVVAAILVVPTNIFSGMHLHNPFMFLSIPASLLLLVFAIDRRSFRTGAEWLSYVDMIRVATLYFLGDMPVLLAHLSVIGTGITYVVTNLLFVRRIRMAGVIAGYFLLPVAMLFVKPLGPMPSVLILIHAIFLTFVVILVQISRTREDRETTRRMDHFQKETASAQAELRLNQVSEALLVHDARNILQRLTLAELQVRQGFANAQTADLVGDVQRMLLPTLDLLSNLSRSCIDLRDFLEAPWLEDPQVFINNKVARGIEICFNPRLLQSIVGNLVRNAREAKPQGSLQITFSFKGKCLTLEDNAGGFPIESIAEGHSTKTGGQGRFLYTLLRHQKAMGLAVTLEPIAKGTRFHLDFL